MILSPKDPISIDSIQTHVINKVTKCRIYHTNDSYYIAISPNPLKCKMMWFGDVMDRKET